MFSSNVLLSSYRDISFNGDDVPLGVSELIDELAEALSSISLLVNFLKMLFSLGNIKSLSEYELLFNKFDLFNN